MKKIIFIILFFYIIANLHSQNLNTNTINLQKEKKVNSLYAGLLGAGFSLTLNYDGIVYQKPDYFLSVHGGIGVHLSFVHGISVNYGQRNNFFEAGYEGSYMLYSKPFTNSNSINPYYLPMPYIGYRYQKYDGGLFLKAYAGILIADFAETAIASSDGWEPWIGFNIGFSF